MNKITLNNKTTKVNNNKTKK